MVKTVKTGAIGIVKFFVQKIILLCQNMQTEGFWVTKEGFIEANFVLTACMALNQKMWSDKNFGQDNKKK